MENSQFAIIAFTVLIIVCCASCFPSRDSSEPASPKGESSMEGTDQEPLNLIASENLPVGRMVAERL